MIYESKKTGEEYTTAPGGSCDLCDAMDNDCEGLPACKHNEHYERVEKECLAWNYSENCETRNSESNDIMSRKTNGLA